MNANRNILNGILDQKILPLFNHASLEISQKVIRACYDGGLRYFEYTNRNDHALDVYTGLQKYCLKELPGMMLGAGTIKNIIDASSYTAAGAPFLIPPLISKELFEYCSRHKILWIPGCGSASEIGMAENWGIELVKIFPAEQLGGPSFIKAIRGPFPDIKLLVTGGVRPDEENISSWMRAGANAVGLGSQLFPKESLEQEEFSGLQQTIENLLGILHAST